MSHECEHEATAENFESFFGLSKIVKSEDKCSLTITGGLSGLLCEIIESVEDSLRKRGKAAFKEDWICTMGWLMKKGLEREQRG